MTVQQLSEFIVNHWILSLAFITISGLLIASEVRRKLYGVAQLGPVQATQMLNHEDAVFIDVRNDTEFATGHLANARHIPLEVLKDRVSELKKWRARPIIAYCRNGQRSNRAAAMLKAQGFENVHNLAGGINAWESAGLPVRRHK
jgi:rhodanese-related sulfurtransferase